MTPCASKDVGGGECNSFDIDVLDRYKFDMAGESEVLWNLTSRKPGQIDGPVRSVRGAIGAASGWGTIQYLYAYPTMFKQRINLRVHALNNSVFAKHDFLSAAADLNGQVCPVANMDVWTEEGNYPIDYVDGGCGPSSTPGTANDFRQVNGPHGSIAEIVDEPLRPVPTRTGRTLVYLDDKSVCGSASTAPGRPARSPSWPISERPRLTGTGTWS